MSQEDMSNSRNGKGGQLILAISPCLRYAQLRDNVRMKCMLAAYLP